MNENIDLTKILKNCPCGTEFWSRLHGNVVFRRIDIRNEYPIILDKYVYTKSGKFYDIPDSECMLVPSREQQDWSLFDAPWYKKDRFDTNTFQPFDRVLVRDEKKQKWECGLFSHIDKKYEDFPFLCSGSCYKICIPYNEHTKHLVGTTDEAPEYYRYWED